MFDSESDWFLLDPISSLPQSSLRRTPYPSVKRRHHCHTHQRLPSLQQPHRRQRVFDEIARRPSIPTVIYDSSKSADHRHSTVRERQSSVDHQLFMAGSGNESDYDNNLPSRPASAFVPSERLTREDDLLLADQNEIILENNTPFETNHHPTRRQSDDDQGMPLAEPARQENAIPIDDTSSYYKEPSLTRRLMDIRSHLLLNTTLDATWVTLSRHVSTFLMLVVPCV